MPTNNSNSAAIILVPDEPRGICVIFNTFSKNQRVYWLPPPLLFFERSLSCSSGSSWTGNPVSGSWVPGLPPQPISQLGCYTGYERMYIYVPFSCVFSGVELLGHTATLANTQPLSVLPERRIFQFSARYTLLKLRQVPQTVGSPVPEAGGLRLVCSLSLRSVSRQKAQLLFAPGSLTYACLAKKRKQGI